MSATFIFLIIIILVGAAIGGLYFLGLPPFNKTKRDEDDGDGDGDGTSNGGGAGDVAGDEDGAPVTGAPVTGSIAGYEVLQNTRADKHEIGFNTFSEEDGDTLEQCMTHCHSLDDCVYFSPSIVEPGKCFFYKGDADILSRDADVGVTTYKKKYDRTDGAFISVSGGNPTAGEGNGLYRGDYTQDHTQCTDICDDIPDCQAVVIDDEGCRVHQSAINLEINDLTKNAVLYTKRPG